MRKLIRAFILLTHFSLLAWIIYVLSYAGTMLTTEVALHFLGLSTLGFLTIRGTSYIEMKFFKNDSLKKKKRRS